MDASPALRDRCAREPRASRAERAEREREESAAQAVAAECARIARELHGLVAHSMGIVVLQAQGAQRSSTPDLEAAREALQAIEVMSRNGLAEMRRLLALLTDEHPGHKDAPQPALDHLSRRRRGAVRQTRPPATRSFPCRSPAA